MKKELKEISVNKNEKYIVDIVDNGFEGEGIAKINGYTIFVPNAIKGEKCEILIVKVLSSHGYGKIVKIIEQSDERVETDCETYKRCGGCDLRHMKYEYTLKLKKEIVQSLVNKGIKNKIEVKNTIGMENPFYYRNKAQFPVGINEQQEPVIGVFAQRTHTIVPIKECLIQNKISQKIATRIVEIIKENNLTVYNEQTQKGLFRHIVIKVGIKTNQVMCILVLNEENGTKEKGNSLEIENKKIDELVEKLKQEFPEIKTIVKNINNKNTNVILGNININLYGNGYIEDILGEYRFLISPMSLGLI